MKLRRIFDLSLTLVTIPIWGPIFASLCLVKYLADGGPVFYLSERLGRDSSPIKIYKFRTMVRDTEFISAQIKNLGRTGFEAIPLDCPVYTSTGRFFERFQFVELPQLINVLFGDLSLIGYRPLPREHYMQLQAELGEDLLRQRHAGLPGITGFAQLSGKHELSNEERLRIEIAEVDLFNRERFFEFLIVYLCIILLTPLFIISGRNRELKKLKARFLKI